MKASFLFNMLGTTADNLRAVIEFNHIQKNRSIKLPFETKEKRKKVLLQ